MKKLLICLLVAVFLNSCEQKPLSPEMESFDTHNAYGEHIHFSNMHYILFKYGEALALTNVTKDSLEVALLRKQLTQK